MIIQPTRRGLLAVGAAALLLPGCVSAASLIAPTAGATGFTHGVASGDPGQTSVALWTRYAGKSSSPERLKVEIASDLDFRTLIATHTAEASPSRDWCARVTASGLPAGQWVYYRFSANGEMSPVGRTRTLPAKADSFRIAVFSCSNGTSGWFNAYAHAAQRDDIDLAIHTGDYIYESVVKRPDAVPGIAQERHLAPDHEIITLADYRARYASYRLDPDLQAIHARLPMISVWDDHETANNSWKDGADAHDPAKEGPWAARRDAGMRAYHEWLPMSDKWWGDYRIGDLATIHRLETRLAARTFQLEDALAKASADAPNRRAVLEAFKKGPLADPARTMMGATQEKWLADGLKSSVNDGVRWQILAQQVIMGEAVFPTTADKWFAPGYQMTAEDQAQLAARKDMSDLHVPFSMDKWDGYPVARERLYASARAAKANLVTLTGDSHNAWAFNLGKSAGDVGVEFAGQSVSSYGYERRFAGDPKRIAADFVASNPDLKWMDASQRGYFVLDIRRDRIETEYVFVPAKDGRTSKATGTHKIAVEHGARKLAV